MSHGVSQVMYLSHGVSQVMYLSRGVSQVMYLSHGVSQVMYLSHTVSQVMYLSHVLFQVMYLHYFLGQGILAQPFREEYQDIVAENTYVLALDGDVDFQPEALLLLLDLMKRNNKVAAACGRIHPIGAGSSPLASVALALTSFSVGNLFWG